jgi:hypothetical protein
VKTATKPELIKAGALLWEAEEAERAFNRKVRGHITQGPRPRPSDAVLYSMGLDALRNKKRTTSYSKAWGEARAKASNYISALADEREIPS